MEYIYAALLLHRLGKPINEENLKSVLSAAGAQPDEGRIKALVAAISEINIDEVLKSAAAVPVAAPAAQPAAAAKPEAAPKEEAKEKEKKEEEALAGLSALFG